MSKKPRKPSSRAFVNRTTMKEGEVIIHPAPASGGTSKHYVGGLDHEPTEEEALQMGRALYDAIRAEQARNARSQDNS